MPKVLGTKEQVYLQTNNAQVYLFDDYFFRPLAKFKKKATPEELAVVAKIEKLFCRYIACGPTCAAMAFDICGWPVEIFESGAQLEDVLLMVFHNPKHLAALNKRRPLNYDDWPPNEIPQAYDVLGKVVFGSDKACKYMDGFNFEIAKGNVEAGICSMVAVKDHYILVVGYDDEKGKLICNDPFSGAGREIDASAVSEWRVDFYPFKPNYFAV